MRKTFITILLVVIFSMAAMANPDTTNYKLKFDSLVVVNSQLRSELFLSNYKIEKVRFYLNITLRRPILTKFLKGWIRRAVED